MTELKGGQIVLVVSRTQYFVGNTSGVLKSCSNAFSFDTRAEDFRRLASLKEQRQLSVCVSKQNVSHTNLTFLEKGSEPLQRRAATLVWLVNHNGLYTFNKQETFFNPERHQKHVNRFVFR